MRFPLDCCDHLYILTTKGAPIVAARKKKLHGGRRRGAGRPGETNGKRSQVLNITLSDKEKETLKRASGREPLATWARRTLLEAARRKKSRA